MHVSRDKLMFVYDKHGPIGMNFGHTTYVIAARDWLPVRGTTIRLRSSA